KADRVMQASMVDGLSGLLQHAADSWTRLAPLRRTTETVSSWFSVDERQVALILEQVRSRLPTTEVLLIGKPQAGKSSIVRGLTGVSSEIVGQGFRPHTQHTQRYDFPTSDLPLLIFIDTVGLGDVTQATSALVEELTADLQQESGRARIFVLTVKITDFATDTLQQIARQLRQQFPAIPCLLAVSCLHELYPAEITNHPADYPPHVPSVRRALAEMQKNFGGLCDRAVLIDFTLEEDGFYPVFYGLGEFVNNLTDLLPEAEARAIHSLLGGSEGEMIGGLYREAGRRYILPFAIMAATAAAVPLPFATMPVLTALQVSLVGLLGKLYGQSLTPAQAGGIVSAIAGGFVAQMIGRELIKFIPGLGSVIAASWAAAYTWALGEAACVYFGDILGGKKPDPKRIQEAMQTSFKAAQERFKQIPWDQPND
ncbi:MAG TPA: GTPase, partial [Coleofasciculaceae cyanobacterium]